MPCLTERSCLGGRAWDDNAAMYEEVVRTMRLMGFSAEVCACTENPPPSIM